MNKLGIRKGSFEKSHTLISNSIIYSNILTMPEKALLIYMLAYPEDKILNRTQLHIELNENESDVDKWFMGLQEKGYVCSVKQFDENGKFAGYNYIIKTI